MLSSAVHFFLPVFQKKHAKKKHFSIFRHYWPDPKTHRPETCTTTNTPTQPPLHAPQTRSNQPPQLPQNPPARPHHRPQPPRPPRPARPPHHRLTHRLKLLFATTTDPKPARPPTHPHSRPYTHHRPAQTNPLNLALQSDFFVFLCSLKPSSVIIINHPSHHPPNPPHLTLCTTSRTSTPN